MWLQRSSKVSTMKSATCGVAVSSYTSCFVDTHHSMVVTLTPYIIRFSRGSILSTVRFTEVCYIHLNIGKEWSSVSKAAKDLIKKML